VSTLAAAVSTVAAAAAAAVSTVVAAVSTAVAAASAAGAVSPQEIAPKIAATATRVLTVFFIRNEIEEFEIF
jgi:hypothetical protein